MSHSVTVKIDQELEADYRAIRTGVGVVDLSGAGLLSIHGDNAVQFLNGLVSNDIKSLQVGEGVVAAFPNLQGKLVALARIYRMEPGLLLELDRINREKIFRNLSRFVPAGQFFLADLSEQWGVLSLQGPRSEEMVGAVAGRSIPAEPAHRLHEAEVAGHKVKLATRRRCGEPGYDLMAPVEHLGAIREALAAALDGGAVRMIGPEALEIARIEAGLPREGADAGEDYIILETGLPEAVSYTKGCYLGQEVIARIHWRGQPARQLRGMMVEDGPPPPAGSELWAIDGAMAGRKVGDITSSTFSPGLGRSIALGYVHRYYLAPETILEIKQEDAVIGRARLVELPFIKSAAQS